jgi:hypothetical protein
MQIGRRTFVVTKASMGNAICTFAAATLLLAAADAARAGDGRVNGVKGQGPPSTNKTTPSPVVRDHRDGSSQTGGTQTSNWGNGTVRDHRKPIVELHFP